MFLPPGILPGPLLQAACRSPEVLHAYVQKAIDLPNFKQLLSVLLFKKYKENGEATAYQCLQPTPRDALARLRVFTETKADIYNKGAVYDLAGTRCLSISWVDTLFQIDTLLQDREGYLFGWVCVLLLPIVRLHNPAAYELLLAKLYRSFALDTTLHADSLADHFVSPVFTFDSFNKLSRNSPANPYAQVYPGLSAKIPYAIQLSLSSCAMRRKSFRLVNDPAHFTSLVSAQLYVTVPAARNDYSTFPGGFDMIMQSGVEYDVYTGHLTSRVANKSLTTGNVIKDAGGNDAISSDPVDDMFAEAYASGKAEETLRMRRHIVSVVFTHICKSSLTRNKAFLSHVYTTVDPLFNALYTSVPSATARESLTRIFAGWSDTHPLDLITDFSYVWIPAPSSVGYEEESEHSMLNHMLYTIVLDTHTDDTVHPYDLDPTVSHLPTIPNLRRICRDYLYEESKDRSDPNPLLLNPEISRDSRQYFTAYTLALANAMGEWGTALSIHGITKQTRDLRSIQSGKINLYRIASDIGLDARVSRYSLTQAGLRESYTSFTKGSITPHAFVNVPRFMSFLADYGYLGCLTSGLFSAIKQKSSGAPPVENIYLLHDSTRQYYPRLSYLLTRVIPDLFVNYNPNDGTYFYDIQDVSVVAYDANNKYLDDKDNCVTPRVIPLDTPALLKLFSARYSASIQKNAATFKEKKETYISVNPSSNPHKARVPLYVVEVTLSDKKSTVIPIGIVPRKFDNYFVLPWTTLTNMWGVKPPKPHSVYAREISPRIANRMSRTGDRCSRGWGLYFDYVENGSTHANFDAYLSLKSDENPFVQLRENIWPIRLNKEQLHLKKGVRVFKDVGYVFSYAFLKSVRHSHWEDSLDIMSFVPGLDGILNAFSSKSINEIKFDISSQKKGESLKSKKERIALARSVGKQSKERVPFSFEEDLVILKHYKRGMTEQDKAAILKACQGHEWHIIVRRAFTLCEKMVKMHRAEGTEVEYTKLPVLRVNKRLRALLSSVSK
jgi:hypothetical protein